LEGKVTAGSLVTPTRARKWDAKPKVGEGR